MKKKKATTEVGKVVSSHIDLINKALALGEKTKKSEKK